MSATLGTRRLPLSGLTPTATVVVTVLDEADEPLTRVEFARRPGCGTASPADRGSDPDGARVRDHAERQHRDVLDR